MYTLLTAFIAMAIAQLLKPIFSLFLTKKLNLHLIFDSGAFPSSHTSAVTAMTFSIGLQTNFDSFEFAIAAVLSAIVIYDARNVRYYAGKNIALTKQFIKDVEGLFKTRFASELYQEKIKTVLGHKSIEVLGGFVVGIVVAFVMFYYIPITF